MALWLGYWLMTQSQGCIISRWKNSEMWIKPSESPLLERLWQEAEPADGTSWIQWQSLHKQLSPQMPGPVLGTRMQPWAKQIPALMETYTQRKGELVTQSCPTLCDPVDCNPPGSSVHGILPARILEWVAIPFSRESSPPRGGSPISCIAGRFFTVWATRQYSVMNSLVA